MQRQEPRLVEFGLAHGQQAASKINVLTVEIDGLTDAESSDREQAEQRAVGDRQQP